MSGAFISESVSTQRQFIKSGQIFRCWLSMDNHLERSFLHLKFDPNSIALFPSLVREIEYWCMLLLQIHGVGGIM